MKSLEFKLIKIDSAKSKAKCQKVLNAFGLKTKTSASISHYNCLMYSNHNKIFVGVNSTYITPDNKISVKQLKKLLSLELLKTGRYIIVKALSSKMNWIVKLDEVKESGGEIIFHTKAAIKIHPNNDKIGINSVGVLGRFVRFATWGEIVKLNFEYINKAGGSINDIPLIGRTNNFIFMDEVVNPKINWSKIRAAMARVAEQYTVKCATLIDPAIVRKITSFPCANFYTVSTNSTDTNIDSELDQSINRQQLIKDIQLRKPKINDLCVFTDHEINTTPVCNLHLGLLIDIDKGVKYPYRNSDKEGFRHACPVSIEEARIIFNS